MKTGIRAYAERFLRDRKKRNRFVALVSAVSLVVVLLVSHMNTLQAISMTDGRISITAANDSIALTGRDNRLTVNVEAKAARANETTFLLRADTNGADLSDRYVFTKAEIIDPDGVYTDANGEALIDGTPESYVTTLIDDYDRQIALYRSDADEQGIVTYSFTLAPETETRFALEFAEGSFTETVDEYTYMVNRSLPAEEALTAVEEVPAAEEAVETLPEDAENPVIDMPMMPIELVEDEEVPEPAEDTEITEDAEVTEDTVITQEEAPVSVTEEENTESAADDASGAASADANVPAVIEDTVTEDASTTDKSGVEILDEEVPKAAAPADAEIIVTGDKDLPAETTEDIIIEEEAVTVSDQTRVVTSDIILFAGIDSVTTDEVMLTAKTYTLAFTPAERDVEALMDAEAAEAAIVSGIVLQTDMVYAEGDAPLLNNAPLTLSWATRTEGANEALLVQRSALYSHTLTATVYEDGTYQTLLNDGAEITVEGTLPEDAIALAYPMEIELSSEEETAEGEEMIDLATGEEIAGDTENKDYEVVCTYDISLFRPLAQVEAEQNAADNGATDNGTVDTGIVINIDGIDYAGYEPAEGNFLSVNIRAPQIAGDDAASYSVLRTENLGEATEKQTEMEVAPAESMTENATSVTFYTDHFTPYSVVREKSDGEVIWFDYNATTNGNGKTKETPYRYFYQAVNEAKATGKPIVFLSTFTVEATSGEGANRSFDGENKVKLIRYYDDIGTNANVGNADVRIGGFEGPMIRVPEGITLNLTGFDIDGAGVDAVAPMVVVEKGATANINNCYMHHGYNTKQPDAAQEAEGLYGRGGAIGVRGGTLTLNGTGISNCMAILGGGIHSAAYDNVNPHVTLNGTPSQPTIIENGDLFGAYKQGQYPYVVKYGGGLYVHSTYLTINENSIIRNNTATGGGGIFAAASDVTLNGGEILGNRAIKRDGKNNYQRIPSHGNEYDSTDNFLASGGGIWLVGSVKQSGNPYSDVRYGFAQDDSDACLPAMLRMKGGKVNDNTSGGFIDGVYYPGGTGGGISVGHILQGMFKYNKEGIRPGFIISGGEICNNTAPVAGGGIYFNGGEGLIEAEGSNKVYIRGNTTTGGNDMIEGKFSGGGIFVHTGSYLQIMDAVVTNNRINADYPFPELKQGGGIAACKTSSTKLNNDRGVAVYDNEVPASWNGRVGYSKTGYYGNRQATGTDIAFISSEKTDNGYLTFAHETYLNTRLLGSTGNDDTVAGTNDWRFDLPGEPDHGQVYDIEDLSNALKYATPGNGNNIYNYEVLSGQKPAGIAILVKNRLTDEQKKRAYAAAKVFIEDNEAFSRGGGIGNNGDLEFGISSASVSIVKKDGDSQRPLENAVFTLWDPETNYSITKRTAADGRLVFRDIPAGHYQLIEVEAPTYIEDGVEKHYFRSNDIWYVDVDTNNRVTVSGPGIASVVTETLGHVVKIEVQTIYINNYKKGNGVPVTVRKEWLDQDGNPIADGGPVRVFLYGGPSLKDQVMIDTPDGHILSAENNYTYTWENQNAYWDEKNKVPAVYTVREERADGYILVHELHDAGKWVEVNTLTPGQRYVFVNEATGKVLRGGDNSGDFVTETDLDIENISSINPNTVTDPGDPNYDPDAIDPRCVWLIGQDFISNVDGVANHDGYRIVNMWNGLSLTYRPGGGNTSRDADVVVLSRDAVSSGSISDIVRYQDGSLDYGRRTLTYNGGSFKATLNSEGASPAKIKAYAWGGESGSAASTIITENIWMPTDTIAANTPYILMFPKTKGKGAEIEINNYYALEYRPNYNPSYLSAVVFDESKADTYEKWVAEYVDGSNFRLRHQATGMYLTYVNSGDSTSLLTLTKNSNSIATLIHKGADGKFYIGNDGRYIGVNYWDDWDPGDVPMACSVGFGTVVYREVEITSGGADYRYTVTNKEQPGYVLPSTGGFGTVWIYGLGFALLGGTVLLAHRRRV